MGHKYILIVAFVMLSGCVAKTLKPPVISDIQESYVKVYSEIPPMKREEQREITEGSLGGRIDGYKVMSEADKGCAMYDRIPEPVSKICVSYNTYWCFAVEFLFACVEVNDE